MTYLYPVFINALLGKVKEFEKLRKIANFSQVALANVGVSWLIYDEHFCKITMFGLHK